MIRGEFRIGASVGCLVARYGGNFARNGDAIPAVCRKLIGRCTFPTHAGEKSEYNPEG
jgi:hypothetical protein